MRRLGEEMVNRPSPNAVPAYSDVRTVTPDGPGT